MLDVFRNTRAVWGRGNRMKATLEFRIVARTKLGEDSSVMPGGSTQRDQGICPRIPLGAEDWMAS